MSRLFIIGNGFDLAHGMHSKYKDFRKYLKGTYPNVGKNFHYSAPESFMDNHGGDFIRKEEAISFLFNNFDNNLDIDWTDFEDKLFNIDWEYSIWSEPIIEKDDIENIFKTSANNEDIAHNVLIACTHIEEFFSDWVKTIEIPSSNALSITEPRKSFKNLIDINNDYFFSFNYTTTLEDLYHVNIKNICHIHGKIGEPLIFGHGHDEDLSDEYMDENIGSEKILMVL